ncbi:glyoxalase/bleomycin resistance/extradiol dioxygenase family protein [Alsobacter soli]|uniref:Glyoxalase/bleomycin resistance/extradiol dioxygenase family protein n=1 Tax=Alsobacter soli TaxID=2109933 RepID=A0A2T1HYW1_9HYPH|nr:VOC family protein [Alsobacter soli]PSC06805.1 glyoxalase/bleomycin resistance/extradiol dioxygenase family protein [Alsobacter soli]
MIDHIGFPVSDYQRSLAFYTKVLRVLGYGLVMEVDAETSGGGAHAGFGRDGRPQFWITEGEPIVGRLHVAFAAADPEAVDDFYAAAMAAGATDNGPPGLRPHYHPNYYGAFVFDLDGHNIEAVCHEAGLR